MSSTLQWLVSLSDWRFWRGAVINAIVFFVVSFALIIAIFLIGGSRFRNPPIHVISHDPEDLGEFCPGDEIPFHNTVTIDEPVVVFYYLGTMQENKLANVIGTDINYPGLPHPIEGTFEQFVEWEVPDIEAGRYYRSMGARDTDGDNDPVFVGQFFTIKAKEKCSDEKVGSARNRASPDHRASGDQY